MVRFAEVGTCFMKPLQCNRVDNYVSYFFGGRLYNLFMNTTYGNISDDAIK